MATVYLSLGSNVGDRLGHFEEACGLLQDAGVFPIRWSSVYETEPVVEVEVDRDQPPFLNQVVEVQTDHSPHQLLSLTQAIELRLGRIHKTKLDERGARRYAPRPLDIDILLCDSLVLDTPELTLPHPRFHRRRYDLIPMVELVPDLMHPIEQQTLQDLLNACSDSASVELYES